ncbi:MAG: SMP-30/gluconolactonase/LRE family protein [Luteibacter sp.]
MAQPRAMVGESVRMDGADVIWVDPPNRRLLRWRADGGGLVDLTLPMPVWSLGRCPDGSWVGAGENGFCRVDVRTGEMAEGPPAPLGRGCRLNDMTVDAQGGLWAGSMHRGLLATKGGLFHAPSVEAPIIEVASGLGVANGMAFVDEGRTLLVIDTLSRTLLAYPAATPGEVLGEPVVVADFLAVPGKPDGMAVAPDGAVWVAMWGGGCIVRLAANGAVEETVGLPTPHVGSLGFATDGTAYVSSSRARLTEATLGANPDAGGLFAVRPP